MDTTAYLYNDKTIQPWKHPPVPCTEVQINKSLNLLGIRSWDELEPGRKFIDTEIDKYWGTKKLKLISILFLTLFYLSFHHFQLMGREEISSISKKN